MLPACMAVPIGLEGGYSHNGQQSISTKILHKRNFMPSVQQLTHGVISGNARKCFYIVIIKQCVICIWFKGSTKQLEIMALVSRLYFWTTHITSNATADALYCLQMEHFKQLALNTTNLPDPIPACPTQFWTDCSLSTSYYVLLHLHAELTKLYFELI